MTHWRFYWCLGGNKQILMVVDNYDPGGLPFIDCQAGDGKPARYCGGGQSGQESCSDRCGSPQRQQHQEEGIRETGRIPEQLERMCEVKTSAILLVIDTLGAVNPKQEEWLQQIPGAKSVVSVQKMQC